MSSSPPDPALWAVVLAGGVGSRFWPVSTPARPKQILPLSGDRPLIVDTVERILPLVPTDRLRVLAGRHLAGPIRDACPEIPEDSLWIEPAARGTAPVLVWAAWRIARIDPDAVMVSLHSDHVIRPEAEFRALVAEAARLAARERRLFTIGIEPARPETGYGYIRIGDAIEGDAEAYTVKEFVEKPDLDTARKYLLRGGYIWNSGIFMWSVSTFLDEVRRHAPEIGDRLPLLEEGRDAEFFRTVPSISVDEAVLERSDRVGVVRATFEWDDVGTWDAVGRTRETDASGNVRVGSAHLFDSERCIAWSDEGDVVVFGASDLVVVRTGHVTLVLPRSRAADLKDLLRQLPPELREGGA